MMMHKFAQENKHGKLDTSSVNSTAQTLKAPQKTQTLLKYSTVRILSSLCILHLRFERFLCLGYPIISLLVK